MPKKISIIKPDDWHLHLREGDILKKVLKYSAKNFSRALIMPNLKKPILTYAQAEKYNREILKYLPKSSKFNPLMTLYLTEKTNPKDIKNLKVNELISAIKYYPSGATTNSTYGVKNFEKVMPVMEQMAKFNIPLCVHGELPGENYDIFDREKIFIEKVLDKIRSRLPDLKITLEHITTSEAINYIKSTKKNLGATITVHHLMINRNHIFERGIRPHYFCLPIAKRRTHQEDLIQTATSGDRRFFLGTDSAPHLSSKKESDCGCAGIFSTPYAVPFLAEIFDRENKLPNLEKFVSLNGARHYNVNTNIERLTLIKKNKPVRLKTWIRAENDKIVFFGSEFKLYWTTEREKNAKQTSRKN